MPTPNRTSLVGLHQLPWFGHARLELPRPTADLSWAERRDAAVLAIERAKSLSTMIWAGLWDLTEAASSDDVGNGVHPMDLHQAMECVLLLLEHAYDVIDAGVPVSETLGTPREGSGKEDQASQTS